MYGSLYVLFKGRRGALAWYWCQACSRQRFPCVVLATQRVIAKYDIALEQ
jgi:hypothetical protein